MQLLLITKSDKSQLNILSIIEFAMRFLILWLLIDSYVLAMHITEVSEFLCSASPKKSAEVTDCTFQGRYISWDLNFLRSLNNWNVSRLWFYFYKNWLFFISWDSKYSKERTEFMQEFLNSHRSHGVNLMVAHQSSLASKSS